MSSGRVSANTKGGSSTSAGGGKSPAAGKDLQAMLEAGRAGCRLGAFELAAAVATKVLELVREDQQRVAAEALLLAGIAQAGLGEIEAARALLASGLRDLGGEVESPFLAPGLYLLCWISLDLGDLRAAGVTARALRTLVEQGDAQGERPLMDALFARLDRSRSVDASLPAKGPREGSLSDLVARLI